MRLKSIKVSGFKSFVDQTNIILPGNIVSVVGPNGCGKSNIIDAVRCMMGESSAKNLRGESIQDMIFNGSTTRKPVARASIEMIFDNSDAGLGGVYAQYAEISIRREITRDGQSNYYFNNTRCRRKDIQDVFLGTGLGPRSYSIIQQGTVSRLIEAKPEELRIYLEEAAGISKYKERRRETETRIRHTRENLDRLNDLRDELEKQLNHLRRQARAAERYQEYKNDERILKARLLAVRWQVLETQIKEYEGAIQQSAVLLEEKNSKQTAINTDIEKQREEHAELSEAFNEVQGRFYSLGADIARVEQTIQNHQLRSQQLTDDLDQARQELQQANWHLETDLQKQAQAQEEISLLTPTVEEEQQQAQQFNQTLETAERAMRQWQQDWDSFNQLAAQSSQQAQVEQTRIQHLEQNIQANTQRLTKLEQECQEIRIAQVEAEIEYANEQILELQEQSANCREELIDRNEKIKNQRDKNHEYNESLDDVRSEVQNLRGRFASLEALQQAALGQHHEAIQNQLVAHELHEKPRLAKMVNVASGWETAVETVLGDYLEAIGVSDLNSIESCVNELTQGTLTFFNTETNEKITVNSQLTALASKVQCEWQVAALMANVYIAETLNSALEIAKQLNTTDSVITPEGIWLGKNWLRVSKNVDPKAGVLKREQELKTITQEIADTEKRVENLQQALEYGQDYLLQYEEERDEKQQELNQISARLSDQQAQMRIKETQLLQQEKHFSRLSEEIDELKQNIAAAEEKRNLARRQWQEALLLMEQHANIREEKLAQRDEYQQHLEETRSIAKQQNELMHQKALQLRALTTQIESLQQSIRRSEEQTKVLTQRCETLVESLSETDLPLPELKESLAELLMKRSGVETELTQSRHRMESVEENVRNAEKQREGLTNAIQQARTQLETQRMEWQALQVRGQTLQEQLGESGFELQQLMAEMPENISEKGLIEEITNIENSIQKLGPINLAAIEEFKTQSERKEYLDKQNDDLIEALQTLESAIHKIDKETRARFKETYETVNTCFQELFPKLFGGGQAYLELTGDDLLSTGVTVMARPPGKRNSTIHLLSGGEKAMTAVALVFSIFQLNPAPFCMLDEVDAPLDEANVGRFCNLLKEMSKTVQFIFITHNKVAMETATHLLGVTMKEPGVSRIVAVDVDEAVALAE